jgi:hypothetical protein
MTHPSFRELFAGQFPGHGELLPVSNLSFLFVFAHDRESFFTKLGDVDACAELGRLDNLVRDEATKFEGTIVPSSLDVLVVAFPDPLAALNAGMAIRAAAPFSIAISLHSGRCIALGRHGKAEFFGETLHRGQALLADCPAGSMALSAAFIADRTVAVAVHESGMHLRVDTSSAGPYAGRRVSVLAPAAP